MKNVIIFVVCVIMSLISFKARADESLFQVNSKWIKQNGEVVNFSKIKDNKYKVITMIFTSCPSACPLMMRDLKKLDSILTEKQKKNVNYHVFSIDPIDSISKLNDFYVKFNLDNRFSLYKGEESVIRELASLIEFKYKMIEPGMYSHSTRVVLLNPNGVIVGQTEHSVDAYNLAKLIK